MAEVVLSVEVGAPAAEVWAAAVDWESQREWMIGTHVWQTTGGPTSVGSRIAAFTGVGPLGFLDTMQVTHWQPPRRCLVRHDGRVVRGTAAFEVEELPEGRARFVWSEWLELPLGRLGQAGWLVVSPIARVALQVSLRRFARYVEARSSSGSR